MQKKNELMLEFALDKIQALLDEGKITEEAANSMAESFVNQYMTEGNAYNKAIKKYENDSKKSHDKMNKLKNLYDHSKKIGDERMASFADKKMEDEVLKNNDKLAKLNLNSSKYTSSNRGIKNIDPDVKRRSTNGVGYANRRYIPSAREDKNHWMYISGNDGMSPEERYKANRYLDLQNTLRESFDEMQLGLYEAADAGLLDPDFIPVMIEAVEFYLES